MFDMTTQLPEQGCPKCGGQSGYSFIMTECHAMSGGWGEQPSSGDNGNRRYSLASCEDCGHKFQIKNLVSLGAIQGL